MSEYSGIKSVSQPLSSSLVSSSEKGELCSSGQVTHMGMSFEKLAEEVRPAARGLVQILYSDFTGVFAQYSVC